MEGFIFELPREKLENSVKADWAKTEWFMKSVKPAAKQDIEQQQYE